MDKTFDVEQIEQYEVTPAEVIAGSQQHQTRTSVEKRLLRKADFVIIPLFSIVHLVSYLDRNSIGNARIMGLQKDLHMTAGQFYNCLTMFFIGYGISMFPANLTAKKFKPNRSLGVACMFFGICLCGMAEAKNYSTILALRILLGCGQGFVQLAMIYCSIWYRRDEMATRTGNETSIPRCGIFYACATLSGAFGGLIAYGVQANMTSPTGRSTWSWLFLIEGVLAVGVGLAVVVILPRFPDDLHRSGKPHWLFNQEEIDLAHNRYAVHTQLFSVIPYTCAFVTVIVTGYASDRLNVKGPIIFTCCCVGMLGYILLMTVSSTVARVVATCLVTSACYPIGNLLPVWLSINTPGFTKRGGTWAFSEVFGVAFSIMGTRIYTNPPRYLGGHGTVLGVFTLGAVNVAAAYFWMRYQNNKKERILNDYAHRGQIHPHIAEMRTLEQLEDDHISFRDMASRFIMNSSSFVHKLHTSTTRSPSNSRMYRTSIP
ncbi:hypothetical protein KCU88_g5793, partial [Aureobasidium melanogenum]